MFDLLTDSFSDPTVMLFNVPITAHGLEPKMVFISMGLRTGQKIKLHDKRNKIICDIVIPKGLSMLPRDIAATFKGAIEIVDFYE